VLLTVDLERLEVGPGDLVLDAGCGEGRHCFGCLERGARVIGLDLDLSSLRDASVRLRGRASELHSLGEMTQGDAFRLPFADETFDRVICSEVMEHVHDYQGAIRELVRVMRPGGTIGITIPTATSEHLYFHLTRDYFESPGGHIRIFRPRRLARAMADAGLRVEGVGFAHALHTPYWMLRSVLGLHDEAPGPVRRYRKFLMRASTSRMWTRIERALDWVCPKSLILYGTRVAGGTPL
jgi:SAM-dependent methyltransferase